MNSGMAQKGYWLTAANLWGAWGGCIWIAHQTWLSPSERWWLPGRCGQSALCGSGGQAWTKRDWKGSLPKSLWEGGAGWWSGHPLWHFSQSYQLFKTKTQKKCRSMQRSQFVNERYWKIDLYTIFSYVCGPIKSTIMCYQTNIFRKSCHRTKMYTVVPGKF